MKKSGEDTFLARIREIAFGPPGRVMGRVSNLGAEQELRNAIFSEVQAYSQLIEGKQEVSGIFLELCDLMLDCKVKGIPESSFKVLIANLIHFHTYSQQPSEKQICDLTGMSVLELKQAEEHLQNLDCPISVLRNNSQDKYSGKPGKRKDSAQSDEPEKMDLG